MNSPFSLTANGSKSALIIVFPPGVSGLFNTAIYGLVREVQERLNEVYVTYALSSGNSPDLKDALAAARFVGCESAVVVMTEENDVVRFVDQGPAGDWMLTASPILSELDAPAVVDSYMAAVAEAGQAA